MKNGMELSKGVKLELIKEIKSFFLDERDEEISDFQAEHLLDFMVGKIGFFVYNQAIQDAHKFMSEKVEEMFGLEKRAR